MEIHHNTDLVVRWRHPVYDLVAVDDIRVLHLLQTIYLPETSEVQPFTVVPRSAVYLDCDHLTLRSRTAGPI